RQRDALPGHGQVHRLLEVGRRRHGLHRARPPVSDHLCLCLLDVARRRPPATRLPTLASTRASGTPSM
ncbi:hypothetical protein VTH82DRAFT_8029, partial [Thermothelomyces myriococcoides]